MDDRQVDKALRDSGPLLVILTQTTKSVEPAESAFDNPTLGLDFKTSLGVAVSDFGTNTKDVFTPMQQSGTVIATVKEKQGQTTGEGQAPQEPFCPDDVLLVGGMDQDAYQPSLSVHGDLTLAAFASFVTVQAADPLFSAVWADWLSTITTLGSASRSSWSRIWMRSASLIRSRTRWATRRRQKAYTAAQGGRSCGSIRHWQPVRTMYSSALIISRRVCTGLRPRVSLGSSGSINVHCSSVTSVG